MRVRWEEGVCTSAMRCGCEEMGSEQAKREIGLRVQRVEEQGPGRLVTRWVAVPCADGKGSRKDEVEEPIRGEEGDGRCTIG